MEDTLVSLETAKLAQEKGFNIKTRARYILNISTQILLLYPHYGEHHDKISTDILVPTHSLLQKWLRKIHKINVESNYLPNVEKYRCLFIPMSLKKPNEYSTPLTAFTSRFKYLGKNNYNTYEEALEIGLQEALKLIK